jgi:hypothetical protein
MLNGLAIYIPLASECPSHTKRAKPGAQHLRSHGRRRSVRRLRCVETDRYAAQQVAVLAEHFHRIIALAQEVSICLIQKLLLEPTLLGRRCRLSLKPLEVGLLLILTEVTERLTHLPCSLQPSQPLTSTELTRLLTETLRFKRLLLVSQRSLKARLCPKLLRLQE